MIEDLETGIQKLKDWSERLGFKDGQIGEIIKLFEQAKESQEEKEISEIRNKLKPEFIDKTQQELIDIKKIYKIIS
jgi:hypothetical protein